MEALQIIGSILVFLCAFIFLFYLLSRMQMKAWLQEIDSFFEDKLNTLKKEEHGKEEK